MDRTRLEKPKPINSYSPGKRPAGRSKMRWEDVVKKDMEELGGSDWKAYAADREEWEAGCLMG